MAISVLLIGLIASDLTGIWVNSTLTPMERGVTYDFNDKKIVIPVPDRLTLSDAEAKVYEKALLDAMSYRRGDKSEGDVSGELNSDFVAFPHELTRIAGKKRTSLIIDPPDGKIPFRLSEAEREALAKAAPKKQGYRAFNVAERCLFSELSGPPITPFFDAMTFQIVQTQDRVMLVQEFLHEVRVVRIGGKHAPAAVRQWNGDSIGHWEGGTLLVDTTNFNGKWRDGGEHLHVVEAFTRIDPQTILYRATMDDPTVYSRPWTIEHTLRASNGRIYEYACHEGNYSLPAMLRAKNP
jgi:hypothetical protein